MDGVIIGSFAWSLHNPYSSYRDVDLLVLPGREEHLKGGKYDFHIIRGGTSDALIWNYCTAYSKLTHKINEREYYVAPLELLYVIKRSHIHRILVKSRIHESNVDLWIHQMEMLSELKETIVKNSELKGFFGPEAKNERDTLLRNIFAKRFKETNERVGDSKVDFKKTKEEFFNDKVKREIDHDELHRRVALILRGTEKLLFNSILIPGTVELDKAKFQKLPVADKFALLREEISVLLIERNLIPSLREGQEIILKKSFREIVAHFITNLTGSGNYWLRTYCIENGMALLESWKCNLPKLLALAREITGVKEEPKPERVYRPRRLWNYDSYDDSSY